MIKPSARTHKATSRYPRTPRMEIDGTRKSPWMIEDTSSRGNVNTFVALFPAYQPPRPQLPPSGGQLGTGIALVLLIVILEAAEGALA